MSINPSLIGSTDLQQPYSQQTQQSQAQLSVGGRQYGLVDKNGAVKGDAEHLFAGADSKIFFARQVGSPTSEVVCIKEAIPSGQQALESENQALDTIGTHATIIQKHAYDPASHRLVLERASDKLDDAQILQNSPMNKRCEWVKAVKTGMDHMHDEGVTHGDLNTKNILLRAGDQAIIADFGAAKVFGGKESIPARIDPSLGDFAEPQPPSLKRECVEADKRDFLQLAFNVLTARPGDRVIPTTAEDRQVALQQLPEDQRELASQVFFGTGSTDERIGQLSQLMAHLPEQVAPHNYV